MEELQYIARQIRAEFENEDRRRFEELTLYDESGDYVYIINLTYFPPIISSHVNQTDEYGRSEYVHHTECRACVEIHDVHCYNEYDEDAVFAFTKDDLEKAVNELF